MTPDAKATVIKSAALALGTERIGITHAGPSARAEYYRSWVAAGHAGEMAHLHRNVPVRENPAILLPGAKSIICIAISYHRDDEGIEARPNTGRVARYARGRDYHPVLWRLLKKLARKISAEIDEPFEYRVCVDTAPILERELAARAGLGWIGKNTLLMNEKQGTYVLLGELMTTLELAVDEPVTDHCGTCTRCLDACPTQAFPAPYELNASRCISYFTIEKHGEIPAEFHPAIGDWVFGCDICQEVCPFNRKAPLGENQDLMANTTPAYVSLLDLLKLTAGDYRRLTRGSASRRATREMWIRNAEIAAKNSVG